MGPTPNRHDWHDPPGLSPQDTERRLALIRAAQNDPDAEWSSPDFTLVAGVEPQTFAVYRLRDPDFPKPPLRTEYLTEWRKGRGTYIWPAQKGLRWLIATDRLNPQTWQIRTPRTRRFGTGNPKTQLPQTTPGLIRRALKDTLGLRAGGEHDYVVRSQPADGEGRRDPRECVLMVSAGRGPEIVNAILDRAGDIEQAIADMGGQRFQIVGDRDQTMLRVVPVGQPSLQAA